MSVRIANVLWLLVVWLAVLESVTVGAVLGGILVALAIMLFAALLGAACASDSETGDVFVRGALIDGQGRLLMPGLGLTNAINELTSQHLVSGTARFAGAVATMIMLTVGTMVAMVGASMLGTTTP